MRVQCGRCMADYDEKDLTKTWQRFSNGMDHIRGDCPACGSFIKYLDKKFSIYMKGGEDK